MRSEISWGMSLRACAWEIILMTLIEMERSSNVSALFLGLGKWAEHKHFPFFTSWPRCHLTNCVILNQVKIFRYSSVPKLDVNFHQNYYELLFQKTLLPGAALKGLTTPTAGEDVEQLECSYSTGRTVKWYKCWKPLKHTLAYDWKTIKYTFCLWHKHFTLRYLLKKTMKVWSTQRLVIKYQQQLWLW